MVVFASLSHLVYFGCLCRRLLRFVSDIFSSFLRFDFIFFRPWKLSGDGVSLPFPCQVLVSFLCIFPGCSFGVGRDLGSEPRQQIP